jgi:hypothetical protein
MTSTTRLPFTGRAIHFLKQRVISETVDFRELQNYSLIQSQRLTLHHAIKPSRSRDYPSARAEGLSSSHRRGLGRFSMPLNTPMAYPILALFNSTRHDETLKAISAASNGRYRSSAARFEG